MQKLDVETNKDRILLAQWNRANLSSGKLQDISRQFHAIAWTHKLDETEIGILTTWSDGRHENKPHPWLESNVELTFIGEKPRTHNVADIIRESFSHILDGDDFKNPQEDSIICYNNDSHLVFPTRIWDAQELLWNHLSWLKRQVSEEIIASPKSHIKNMDDRLRSYKKSMKTGKQTFHGIENTLIDMENGIISFNPRENILSIKTWPLRVMQYTLALALMRRIRDTKLHPPFMDTLPTNIVERFWYILDNNLTKFNPDEIANLQYIYAFFLWLYHEMQYKYTIYNDTKFEIDKDIMKDISSMLDIIQNTFLPDKFYK